ncbi:histidine triad nucleotide-binding protein [Buchnera aphidicola]|uniref:Ycff n=1 Tax=Buchnera aphidicola str. USDA (Myzus persicae) TaxID=1009856 RepID=W0NZU2_BUCMP|nr:histidine triad nucleotide-binding protein [Buchnera aphidicola]AHG60031.1 Ycff [Buchnera aphidicola str. USDA (Myzus persicae)]AHG60611.1 Ycff [Buchnera aphidicola str. W106 (Myzus persicae)]AHG61183.1 Ycff [Buchnera aphidicola str. G002 (Myzus persicae)]AHG61756.1 Ycff [Buchnera aphidicola str. F009 (Myzus persicae)]WAI03285.1 MAG: histidine triad nucleotide-binding protein [Buchnera aphidicola (Myzus persicae)]
MKDESIFKKIINKELTASIIYQDKIVTAFKDIKPKAPIHILIIPNIFISSSNDIDEKNKDILAHMFYIAVQIAKKKKISEKGYRIIINCNKDGGQEINYLHMHLLGGKKLRPLS